MKRYVLSALVGLSCFLPCGLAQTESPHVPTARLGAPRAVDEHQPNSPAPVTPASYSPPPTAPRYYLPPTAAPAASAAQYYVPATAAPAHGYTTRYHTPQSAPVANGVSTRMPQYNYVPNGNHATYAPYPNGDCSGGNCHHHCNIQWLIPWTCEDLKMEPVKPSPSYCGCHGLFWCPPEPEEEEDEANGNGNGNGNGKNGNGKGNGKNGNGKNGNGKNGNGKNGNGKNGNGKNGEKNNGKNGNGKNGEKKDDEKEEEEEEAEEPETPTPLMSAIQCWCPHNYYAMEYHGVKVYGWLQQGFTGNFSSPSNRLNFGVNYNNRSNAWLWNQQYFVFEKELKQEDCVNFGFRFDFYGGHDAPDNTAIQIGWFENVNNTFPDTNDYGIDIPQIYGEVHLPMLTKRGVDVRAGWYYTNMGYEVIPGTDTDFYSHAYEFFYGLPFFHSGVQATIHVADTVDFMNSIVRGWDSFFDDNNDVWTYHGFLRHTSCDERRSITLAWITGPEAASNSDNRTQVTAYYSAKFGCCDQWRFVTGGNMAWEDNAGVNGQDSEWYGYSAYLFYTINPRVILGSRAEWFRDDDASRTGTATSYYEVTLGFTYKPYQNLRIRPELRFDWANNGRPYNDNTDNAQTTAAFDVIWDF